MRRLLLPVLVAALVALGACGGGGGDDGGGSAGDGDDTEGATVIEGDEYTYDPAELTVPAGTVRLALANVGALEHDITIDDPRFKITALRGRTVAGSVVLEPGTYEFYCSVPGHRAAGMVGEITAE